MEGLLKSAPQPQENSVPIKAGESSPAVISNKGDNVAENIFFHDGVPIDVYRYFGLELETDQRTKSHVKAIWEFVTKNTNSYSSALLALRRIERKLGSPRGSEGRWDKMYNWVAIRQHMKSKKGEQKQIQEARLKSLEGGEE